MASSKGLSPPGAQEVSAVKKDPTIATDSQGMLKLSTKNSVCETNSELKLRAAFQRRSLAMDLSGIATFDVVEPWVQFLFSQLIREQPRGFAKITLQQLIDCDKQLFVMASHHTLGKLQGTLLVHCSGLTYCNVLCSNISTNVSTK